MFSNTITTKINDHYSANTKKSVYSRLRRIFKLMDVTDNDLNQLIRNDGKDLLTAMEQIEKGKTTLIYTVITVLKLCDIKYPKCWDKCITDWKKDERKVTHNKKQNATPNEDLDINKIQQHFYHKLTKRTPQYAYKKNEDGEKVKYQSGTRAPKISKQKHVRCTLFTLLKRCPLRLTTMSKLKWEDNDTNNYIDLDNHLMVIRQSKTSNKKKEHRKLPLDDSVCKILKAHKKYMNSERVFPNKDGNRTSSECMEGLYRNAVKLWCKETGVPYKDGEMGIHQLRAKSATKDFKNKIQINCTYEELEMIINGCKERGHTVSTVLQHYVLGN